MGKDGDRSDPFDFKGGIVTNRTITFIICLAFTTSCLYQAVYWGFFEINIFEYLSIQDILVRSVLPMIVMLGGVIGAFIGHMEDIIEKEESYEDPELESQRVSDLKTKNILLLFISLILPLIIGPILIAFGNLEGIFLISLAAIYFASLYFENKGWSDYLNNNMNIARPILLSILAVLIGSIGLATYNASKIIHGEEQKLTSTKPENLISQNTAIIGEAANIVFFWERDTKSVIQIKRADIEILIERGQTHAKQNST